MPTPTTTVTADQITAEFKGPWRDDTPVFDCCRKAIAAATQNVDLQEVAALEVTERVQTLRDGVEAELPGHLAAHRCCAGHLADLAFDLPGIFEPTVEAEHEIE